MSRKRPVKSPGKTPKRKRTGKHAAPLVPQPKGGALLRGNPGNKGGTGRPPSAIRERLRGSFADRIHILEEMIEDKKTSAADRLKALDLLAKYGLGTRQEVTGEDGTPIPHEIIVTRRIVDGDPSA